MRGILRRLGLAFAVLLVVTAVAFGLSAAFMRLDRSAMPAEAALLNRERLPLEAAYDILGRSISPREAEALLRTPDGKAQLYPSTGAIRIDDDLVRRGRDIFYRETFGNEVFFTDILGALDGGLSAFDFSSAIFALAGRGTSNLEVRLARDVKVGDRFWRAGEIVKTGLDVAEGETVPLGIRVFYDRGTVRIGVTCALCHASVDKRTGLVVEGAPNTDLEAGLLLALASNPAALWPQSGIQSLADFQTKPDRFVRQQAGGTGLLPDRAALGDAIRTMLAGWPAGSVDTTADLIVNPTSIPSSFTREAWPYGWSGQAAIGPFRGLASLSDLVHGLGNDTLTLAPAAGTMFGVDPELYLGTLLQGAPSSAFRFEPADGAKPSDTLAAVDPTPGIPGIGRLIALPGYVRANYVTFAGLIPAQSGRPAGEAMAALAAFQNTLRPPDAVRPGSVREKPAAERATIELGLAVFARAGCAACHEGPALTSHRVWPAPVIGTEPSRARALANREADVARPQIFATDTPVPLPAEPILIPVPVPDEGQLKLAWAHNKTAGGYKVPGLLGLAWTAPYLHDGGVAVGPDPDRRPGVAATVLAGMSPDPRNSLRALVDRTLRREVTEANRASLHLQRARVTGEGHAFWADREAGYTAAERDALIDYLLSLDRPQVAAAPDAEPPGLPTDPSAVSPR